MEAWQGIEYFPFYSVSDLGRIRHERTGRYPSLSQNQSGVVHVALNREGYIHRRSVALLVARAFVPSINELYCTPINLDGNRRNNSAANLMWRPRWFALNYVRQFKEYPIRGLYRPIIEEESEQQFDSSWLAATTYGLIERDVVTSVINRCLVWPTYQRFRLL